MKNLVFVSLIIGLFGCTEKQQEKDETRISIGGSPKISRTYDVWTNGDVIITGVSVNDSGVVRYHYLNKEVSKEVYMTLVYGIDTNKIKKAPLN